MICRCCHWCRISLQRCLGLKLVHYIYLGIVLVLLLGLQYRLLYWSGNKKPVKLPCAKWKMIGKDGNYASVSRLLRNRSAVPQARQLQRHPLVLYNRVPKCASRTVLGVFKALACQNGFHLISKARGPYPYFTTQEDVASFACSLFKGQEFKIHARHVYYINFTRLKLPEPLYINVVRDPVERAASHYYYLRHGSKVAPRQSLPQAYVETLDECLKRGSGVCYKMAKILPFFCGHHTICRTNQTIALRRAMRTVREQYVVVGLTEDLPAFMSALSTLMPQFFANATKVYHSLSAKLWEKFSTVKKLEMEPATRQKIKDLHRYEVEFYDFVKQRFYEVYRGLKKKTSISSLSTVKP